MTDGVLPPEILAVLSDHVVGSSVLLPGVSYIEIASASTKLSDQIGLEAVMFIRPCILAVSGSDACVVRYSRQAAGTFAIEKRNEAMSATYAVVTPVDKFHVKHQTSLTVLARHNSRRMRTHRMNWNSNIISSIMLGLF